MRMPGASGLRGPVSAEAPHNVLHRVLLSDMKGKELHPARVRLFGCSRSHGPNTLSPDRELRGSPALVCSVSAYAHRAQRMDAVNTCLLRE